MDVYQRSGDEVDSSTTDTGVEPQLTEIGQKRTVTRSTLSNATSSSNAGKSVRNAIGSESSRNDREAQSSTRVTDAIATVKREVEAASRQLASATNLTSPLDLTLLAQTVAARDELKIPTTPSDLLSAALLPGSVGLAGTSTSEEPSEPGKKTKRVRLASGKKTKTSPDGDEANVPSRIDLQEYDTNSSIVQFARDWALHVKRTITISEEDQAESSSPKSVNSGAAPSESDPSPGIESEESRSDNPASPAITNYQLPTPSMEGMAILFIEFARTLFPHAAAGQIRQMIDNYINSAYLIAQERSTSTVKPSSSKRASARSKSNNGSGSYSSADLTTTSTSASTSSNGPNLNSGASTSASSSSSSSSSSRSRSNTSAGSSPIQTSSSRSSPTDGTNNDQPSPHMPTAPVPYPALNEAMHSLEQFVERVKAAAASGPHKRNVKIRRDHGIITVKCETTPGCDFLIRARMLVESQMRNRIRRLDFNVVDLKEYEIAFCAGFNGEPLPPRQDGASRTAAESLAYGDGKRYRRIIDEHGINSEAHAELLRRLRTCETTPPVKAKELLAARKNDPENFLLPTLPYLSDLLWFPPGQTPKSKFYITRKAELVQEALVRLVAPLSYEGMIDLDEDSDAVSCRVTAFQPHSSHCDNPSQVPDPAAAAAAAAAAASAAADPESR